MVGTIIPIVYGERHQGRRETGLWLHAVGAAIGSAGVGALLGLLGAARLSDAQVVRQGAVLAGLGWVHVALAQRDFGVWSIRLPQSRWQVPWHWQFRMSRRLVAFVYGLTLGGGLLTAISSSAYYLLLAWVVLMGSPWLGAVLMGAYGVARVAPLFAVIAGAGDYEEVTRREEILVRWQPAVDVVSGVALAASGGWLLGAAIVQTWS